MNDILFIGIRLNAFCQFTPSKRSPNFDQTLRSIKTLKTKSTFTKAEARPLVLIVHSDSDSDSIQVHLYWSMTCIEILFPLVFNKTIMQSNNTSQVTNLSEVHKYSKYSSPFSSCMS